MGARCDGLDTREITLANTDCKTGQAQIAVLDLAIKHLCGCQEPAGQITPEGQQFTCTITANTKVFFHFHSTNRSHQIVSVGTPSFPSSHLFHPDAEPRLNTHPVDFTSVGTYDFRDETYTNLFGVIDVQ